MLQSAFASHLSKGQTVAFSSSSFSTNFSPFFFFSLFCFSQFDITYLFCSSIKWRICIFNSGFAFQSTMTTIKLSQCRRFNGKSTTVQMKETNRNNNRKSTIFVNVTNGCSSSKQYNEGKWRKRRRRRRHRRLLTLYMLIAIY